MSAIRREFPDLPPIWALATAAGAWVAGSIVPLARFDGLVATALGVALAAMGLALVGWSAIWFRRKKTTIEPRDMPKALIVEGPFRLNRNPIYTGMAVTIFGLALLSGTLSALLVACLFHPIVTQRFIREEEASLRDVFGAEAERYFATTRRW